MHLPLLANNPVHHIIINLPEKRMILLHVGRLFHSFCTPLSNSRSPYLLQRQRYSRSLQPVALVISPIVQHPARNLFCHLLTVLCPARYD
ncbi:hypothetical protein D3C80_1683490 [compost metagenome]